MLWERASEFWGGLNLVSFSADGHAVAFSPPWRRPRVLNLESNADTLSIEKSDVNWIALTPTGHRLLFKYPTGRVRGRWEYNAIELWDVAGGSLLRGIEHAVLSGSEIAVFLTDGRLLTLGPPCPCIGGL